MALNRFWERGTKIVGVGRNYAAHAKELGNEVPKGTPILFLKPKSSYLLEGSPIVRPTGCVELAHEIEIGVVISQKTSRVPLSRAMDSVAGYTLALDMTARDFQEVAKKKGLPWTEAKGHDTFCPVGRFIPRHEIPDPSNVDFWLKVDGQLKQQGNTRDMIFAIPELVSYISHVMTLEEGDIILTGTPAGVGSVVPGSVLTAGIKNVASSEFTFTVIQCQAANE